MKAIQTYFEGEKRAGIYLMILGLLIMAIAIYQFYFLKTKDAYFWVTLLIISTIQIIFGIVLILNSPKQLQAAQAKFSSNPSQFQKEENQRINKTMTTFHRIKLTWYALMAIGILIFLFPQKPAWTSIFSALAIVAFLMLYFDLAAEKRISVYQKELAK